jgi:hypothetical protein
MAHYSSGEKSRARALIIGVFLLIISAYMLHASIKHHDKSSAVFALIIGLVTALGLYSATH